MRIRARGRELIGLVTRRLPLEYEVSGAADGWPAVGVALLSRMSTTLDSVLDLQFAQREADAGTLVRSLYEHAVHFAWLAAEPSASRLQQWRGHDLILRLKADSDAREHGIEALSEENRAELEAEVGRMQARELVLANLAVAADTHWSGKLPGMESHKSPTSFRGFYAVAYRHYSGMAHPTMRGLNRVVDDIGPTRRRVRLETQYQRTGPYGFATIIFALALHVAADALGWPQAAEVDDIFERHP